MPNTQVYAYALGGNAGSGESPASGLLAILANCPQSGIISNPQPITVNEVTTVAAAYASAGFAKDATMFPAPVRRWRKSALPMPLAMLSTLPTERQEPPSPQRRPGMELFLRVSSTRWPASWQHASD